MKLETRQKIIIASVWVARVIVGLTFVVSGWAKSIDPYGFIIKVGEYLAAWNLDVSHEAVVAGCFALAGVEFTAGVLVLTGSLKRFAVWVVAAMMAFMLPLTLYIAIADPVADCGCFGDFWVISNWATFWKNVLLTALTVFLIIFNRRAAGLYAPSVQWLVVAVSLLFALALALGGYQFQPLVDFRPYKVGTEIFAGADSDEPETFLYERNGERRRFSLDDLPDDSWTFVDSGDVDTDSDFDGGITVRDAQGDDVTAEVVDADPDARQLFLIIPQPGMHYLLYAHYVSDLYAYCRRAGVEMIAVTGGSGAPMERWLDWCRPVYKVYTADATALKQLVRGAEALVYTEGGVIRWKRTLASMPADLPDSADSDALAQISVPDSGLWHLSLVGFYLAALLFIYLMSLSPRMLKRLSAPKKFNVS